MQIADHRALFSAVRSVPPDHLAILYRVFAQLPVAAAAIDPAGWTVVFADPGPGAGRAAWMPRVSAAATELRHFGVAVRVVTAVPAGDALPAELRDAVVDASGQAGADTLAGTYLLGGPLHGWHAPRPQSWDRHVDAVVALVRQHRLSEWSSLLRPAPTLQRRHRPGSDSTGVVQFEAGGPVVAKTGPREVIVPEFSFIATANACLTRAGRRALFPDVYAVEVQQQQATLLMEAAEPVSIDDLFTDETKTRLAADATAQLDPHLSSLAEWYRLTAEPDRPPTVADYLYRGRFTALRHHDAFRSTFAARFPHAHLDSLLDAPVLLPGAVRAAGYTAATGWLDGAARRLLPGWGSSVHGDIYMSNMLRRGDGSPVFIDPRTIWDGVQRPDPGYGDPVFDLATLMHGVLPMAAVLHAVNTDRSEGLLDLAAVDLHADELDLSSLRLPLHISDEMRVLERRLLEIPPVPEPEAVVRARLYVGAATSLAGWLKYDRSLRTPESWLATYAFLVWYLSQARTVCEAHNLETT
jgi:hypothetical protein